jgi:hypothetical protein
MTAGEWSITARSSASRSSSLRRTPRDSVTSRNTTTQPRTTPSLPRMGAAVSSMGVTAPSRPSRTVWFASSTTTPSRSTRSAGLAVGSLVISWRSTITCSMGCPSASSPQPVSRRAVGLSLVTRPSSSVAITASPMLSSVTCSCSWLRPSASAPAYEAPPVSAAATPTSAYSASPAWFSSPSTQNTPSGGSSGSVPTRPAATANSPGPTP